MEQINQILGNNLLFIIAVLLVLIIFLLVMLVNMYSVINLRTQFLLVNLV